jgi:acetolactate synthase-1/2/3 large subunit
LFHAAAGYQLLLVYWYDEVQHVLVSAAARLHGHVPGILAALAAVVTPRDDDAVDPERLAEVRDVAPRYAAERIPGEIDALRALRAALPADAVLLGDSLIGMWLERLHPVGGPRLMRFPMGTGTLGFGIPAAVGVKLAAPEREVVTIGGDGATLYNAQELATLRRHGLKVTVIVANDDCFSAIKHNMGALFGRAIAYELVNPDFERFADAFGLAAVALADPRELGDAVADAIAGDVATLIEVPLGLLPGTDLYVGELADAAAGA